MAVRISGVQETWHKIELQFDTGQTFTESPETFRDYRLDVTFRNQDTGETITVPGFFAADGKAAETGATQGSIWQVNFNPPSEGTWAYTASFRTGDDIAVSTDTSAGSRVSLPDAIGTLSVSPTSDTDGGFREKGMILQDEGTAYLQHQGDGDYFVRGGPGVPENFLANPDFDNTRTSRNNTGRHEFDNHASDANPGDPTWDDGRGENILGAVNYLSEQGLNTIYVLTNTVGGDGRDVSPWVDPDMYAVGTNRSSIENAANTTNGLSEDAFSVFDVSKLAQWEILFDHMDDQGIYKNLLFQETENDQLLNGGTSVEGSSLSVERMIYMREMVARYGHNNGIQWNLGEENTNSSEELRDMAAFVKAVDGYDHLIVAHSFPSQINRVYDPLVGFEPFDGTSFQTTAGSIRQKTIEFRDKSAGAGDPWVLAWDEDSSGNAIIDPYDSNEDSTNERALRKGLWGHLTAGGSGVNWYIKGSSGHSFDQNIDDFKGFASLWDWTAAATDFFNTYIPFWDMSDADSLTRNSGDYVMAREGDYYVIYLDYGDAGDVRLDLTGQSGESFNVFWYNPRKGGPLVDGGTIQGGAVRQIGGAPADTGKDWVMLVRNTKLPDTPTSVPPETIADTDPGDTTDTVMPPVAGDQDITLTIIDPDTDQEVGTLSDGSTIDLEALSLDGLNIEATSSGQGVGSVTFALDGQPQTIESVAPFALFGDRGGDFSSGSIEPGQHTLTVRLFSGSNGEGTLLGQTTLSFTVTGDSSGNTTTPPVGNDDPPAMNEGSPGMFNAPEGEQVHLMEDGLVVMQAESGEFILPNASGNDTWKLVRDFPGYTGQGYLIFDTNTDYFNTRNAGTPETGPMKYTFRVEGEPEDIAGTYYITLRSTKPRTGEPNDRNNDFFVATGPAGEEPQDWKKVFFSGQPQEWLWGQTYDVHEKKSPATLEITQPGEYTIFVSGRSRQAGFDKIHIQKDRANRNDEAATSEIVIKEAQAVASPPPANRAPEAVDDEASVTSGESVTVNVLANDQDADNDTLSLVSVTDSQNLDAEIVNGQVRIEATGSFVGTQSVSYTVTDGKGGNDTGSVEVTVAAPPVSAAPPPSGGGGAGSGAVDVPDVVVTEPVAEPIAEPPTNVQPFSIQLNAVLSNVSEAANTASRTKVADIVVEGSAGAPALTLGGEDAGQFEIIGTELFLRAGTSLDAGAKSTLSVTVNGDDPQSMPNPDGSVAFSLIVDEASSDVSVVAETPALPETPGGTTDFTFTVTRSVAVGAETFDYAVTSDEADAADFGGTLPQGEVMFADGEAEQTVVVQVVGDSEFELDERFTLTISGSGGTISASATATITGEADLLGTAESDTLTGGTAGEFIVALAGDDTIDAGGGNDIVYSGDGLDTITLGAGRDALVGTLSELNGDTLTDLAPGDRILILNTDFTSDDLTFDPETGVLSIDSNGNGQANASLTLPSAPISGRFMAAMSSGDTVVTYVGFLPERVSGVAVDSSQINGIDNPDFFLGDGSTDQFTLTVHQEGQAAYDSSLGVYEVDENGTMVDARVVVASTQGAAQGPIAISGTVEEGHRLGFFLIQDGADEIALGDTFAFVDPEGNAATLSDGRTVALEVNGMRSDMTVFFSDRALNRDGLEHVMSGAGSDAGSMVLSWEDQLGGGDRDYEDLVITVDQMP